MGERRMPSSNTLVVFGLVSVLSPLVWADQSSQIDPGAEE